MVSNMPRVPQSVALLPVLHTENKVHQWMMKIMGEEKAARLRNEIELAEFGNGKLDAEAMHLLV